MLAIKPQCSLKDARHYFKEHLTVGDYYTEGQHVPGHWFGQGDPYTVGAWSVLTALF